MVRVACGVLMLVTPNRLTALMSICVQFILQAMCFAVRLARDYGAALSL